MPATGRSDIALLAPVDSRGDLARASAGSRTLRSRFGYPLALTYAASSTIAVRYLSLDLDKRRISNAARLNITRTFHQLCNPPYSAQVLCVIDSQKRLSLITEPHQRFRNAPNDNWRFRSAQILLRS
jgi:hypothetical protein